MRLNSIGESTATSASLAPRKPSVVDQEPTLEGDQLTTTDSEGLNRTLQETQAVRADKVAQAKALIADDSYPSHAQVAQVADLLAKNLGHKVVGGEGSTG
jgi:hypothetical protein